MGHLMQKATKKPGSYEVEFIPLERRMCERRSLAAQLEMEPYLGVERRATSRRQEDGGTSTAFPWQRLI